MNRDCLVGQIHSLTDFPIQRELNDPQLHRARHIVFSAMYAAVRRHRGECVARFVGELAGPPTRRGMFLHSFRGCRLGQPKIGWPNNVASTACHVLSRHHAPVARRQPRRGAVVSNQVDPMQARSIAMENA
jgi:hypothetical protein